MQARYVVIDTTSSTNINGALEKAVQLKGYYYSNRKVEMALGKRIIGGNIDWVQHEILLYKLQAFGISGDSYSWIKNYSANRTQFTEVNVTEENCFGIKIDNNGTLEHSNCYNGRFKLNKFVKHFLKS